MTAPNAAFIEWLRTTRQAAGLSQQDVADALKPLGISIYQQTIAKIESKARGVSLDEAVALTGLFGVTIDTALGLSGNPDEGVARLAQRSVDSSVLLVKIRNLIDAEFGGAR